MEDVDDDDLMRKFRIHFYFLDTYLPLLILLKYSSTVIDRANNLVINSSTDIDK